MLAVAVILSAMVVRFAHLDDQSYWTDEAFSVNQAAGSVGHALAVGQTEVHTPLYALLLLVWIRLGGTATAWTHGLSAIVGLLAIVVTYTGLRTVRLTAWARWTAVAGTASCGLAISYSQETRPYGLALLGATGVTAAAAAMVAAVVEGRSLRWIPWLGWGLVAATAHLLGAVLVCVLTSGLVVITLWRRRPLDAGRVVLTGAVAIVPQLAWLWVGLSRPGFAAGTSWIHPPVPADVFVLATSVFSAGHLDIEGGFGWASPFGVLLLLALAVVGLGLRLRRHGCPAGQATPIATPTATPLTATSPTATGQAGALEGPLAVFLLGIAVGTVVLTFAVAQVVHIWTLRNMIVVVPSLTWGTSWGLIALPGSRRASRVMAYVLLAGMTASLVATNVSLRAPYKTDWRGAVLLLARVRAEHPDATFTFFRGTLAGMYVAADRTPRDPYIERIGAQVTVYRGVPTPDFPALARVRGPQIVLYYHGMGYASDPGSTAKILDRLGDPACRPVPVYGLVIVSCPGTLAQQPARSASP